MFLTRRTLHITRCPNYFQLDSWNLGSDCLMRWTSTISLLPQQPRSPRLLHPTQSILSIITATIIIIPTLLKGLCSLRIWHRAHDAAIWVEAGRSLELRPTSAPDALLNRLPPSSLRSSTAVVYPQTRIASNLCKEAISMYSYVRLLRSFPFI